MNNILNFYMKSNDLKNILTDEKYSVADNLYGSIILAVAFNSEFGEPKDISKIVRMLILSEITLKNPNLNLVETLKKGKQYEKEAIEYLQIKNLEAKEAFRFRITDFSLTKLIDEKGDYLSFENLYKEALNLAIFKLNHIEDYEKYKKIFKFYYLNYRLKNKLRSGWDKKHWNVKGDRIERISEHIIGTIALAIAIDSEFDFNIDINKVIEMLAIHEVGEILIGDITPFDGVTPQQKKEIEHNAIEDVLECLTNKTNLINLIFEFNEHQTAESMFSHYCDKIEADIQAKVYQDNGMQNPLDEQQNNVVFKSDKVKHMLENGAQTAFDIWYLWDKSIYENNIIFTLLLEFIKDNDLIKFSNIGQKNKQFKLIN